MLEFSSQKTQLPRIRLSIGYLKFAKENHARRKRLGVHEFHKDFSLYLHGVRE